MGGGQQLSIDTHIHVLTEEVDSGGVSLCEVCCSVGSCRDSWLSPNPPRNINTHSLNMQDTQYWIPHPDLDLELVPVLQRYVNSIPIDEQRPLLANEEYATPEAAFNRVQNSAFCQGFLVVKGSGSEKIGRIRINCVHSGKQRNTRRIEEGERRRATKV